MSSPGGTHTSRVKNRIFPILPNDSDVSQTFAKSSVTPKQFGKSVKKVSCFAKPMPYKVSVNLEPLPLSIFL